MTMPDRVTPQPVGHSLLPQRSGFDRRAIHAGLTMDTTVLGQVLYAPWDPM